MQVQSQAPHNTVVALSYSICGPFSVVTQLYGGTYHLLKASNQNGPLLKFPMKLIQPNLTELLMCNLIDASDILYLIIDHTPTANPLAKASNLKSYNKV